MYLFLHNSSIVVIKYIFLSFIMNNWIAPPSQHIPPDKKLVRANTIRQLARGGLFFLGVISTVSCVWLLLNHRLISIINSPLVFVLFFSVLAVSLCARHWFWLKKQPLTAVRQEQITIIILCLLGLIGWAIYYSLS